MTAAAQQQPGAVSVQARGLGQYSADRRHDSPELPQNSETDTADPAGLLSLPAPDLDLSFLTKGAVKEPSEESEEQEQQDQQQQWSQRSLDQSADEPPTNGQPGNGQPRAPGPHMRARRRPRLEAIAEQPHQPSQPAAGAMPPQDTEGQDGLRQAHTLTADVQSTGPPSSESPEGPAARDPDLTMQLQLPQPSRPNSVSLKAGQVGLPERNAELEKRRKSQEFVAQVARTATQMRSVLADSTSSSEAVAPEGPSSLPEHVRPEGPCGLAEGSLAAWFETAANEQRPRIAAGISQGHPQQLPEQKQGLLGHEPLHSPQEPHQAAVPSEQPPERSDEDEADVDMEDPGMRDAKSQQQPDSESDIVVDLDSPSPQKQKPAAQFSASQPQGSLDSPMVESPAAKEQVASQTSQPASCAEQEAARPPGNIVDLGLEYRADYDASPLRLSLNLDLTASSRQTPPGGSAQAPVPAPISPEIPCERGSHPAMDVQPSPPSSSVHAAAALAAQGEDAPAEQANTEHPTPMTAHLDMFDADALQLSNVPLSALHPRGLFLSQPADRAAGKSPAGMSPVLQQDSPGMLSSIPAMHDRSEAHGNLIGPGVPMVSAGNSQDIVVRHSDPSSAAVQPQQMHAPDTPLTDKGAQAMPSQVSDASHTLPEGADDAGPSSMQIDQPGTLQHEPIRGPDSRLHAFRPRSGPPTREELQASMIQLGITDMVHQNAFYGNPADVPERPIGEPFYYPCCFFRVSLLY